MLHIRTIALSFISSFFLIACAPMEQASTPPATADQLLIVDCLLPPQVRKLGSNFTYAAARRPVKTSAGECEIRGGEYVSYDRADYRTALTVWLPQAQAGEAEAQNYVGQIYEKGLGSPIDYQTAAHWYRLAADQGYAEAQINLGYLYEKGFGVEKDSAMALNLYRRASGIRDDSLRFASTVEVARVSREELANLEQQLASEREKNLRFQEEIAAIRDDMVSLNRDLELARAQKRNKELELQLARSQQDSGIENTEQRLREEIALFERKLSEGEQALRDYQAKESQLQLELEEKTIQLASAELNQGRMSIELIDPPMSITRGVRGTVLDKAVREKEVFGKINTAGGVRSLTINGQPHELDEFNMFWVNLPIRDSVTPVEIVAVDNYGQKVDFSFSIFADQTLASASAPGSVDLELGRYRALIIGNNAYQHIPSLKTAVTDAQAAAEVLRERYGFETTVLLNANRYEILTALDELRRTATPEDNLLIYYAGHGEIDRLNKRGYWLPVDAEQTVRTNWISNTAITDILNTIPARQLMVIADSCYSGTLGQSSLSAVGPDMDIGVDLEWVQAMEDIKSRTVLTSGGVKPVLDIGGGEHSVFAEAFLSTLTRNEGLLEGHRLYREVMRRMRVSMARINQTQVPEYAPIKHAGHEGGEFFLKPVDRI